jgi:hypothetical protein
MYTSFSVSGIKNFPDMVIFFFEKLYKEYVFNSTHIMSLAVIQKEAKFKQKQIEVFRQCADEYFAQGKWQEAFKCYKFVFQLSYDSSRYLSEWSTWNEQGVKNMQFLEKKFAVPQNLCLHYAGHTCGSCADK